MKTLMRETFVHVSSCEDKEDSLEENNHVVPLVLANLLQDIHPYKAEDEPDMLIASCENSETSSHDSPSFPTAKDNNGNVLSATFTEGESSLDVLKCSTNHAMVEQILVEPSLDTCAENRYFLHIAGDADELKLLSSLNTLGYIDFDVSCNLSYLKEKLFAYVDLPCLCRHTYHVIDRYNNIGQYMIHRVYICAILNSPFIAHNCDPIEDCTSNNLVMPCSSNFYATTQVKFKEGEHMFLVSTNLLQDSTDKDGVHHDHGAYKFGNIYMR